MMRRLTWALSRLIGVVALLLLLAFLWVHLFGITIDASHWRDSIATKISSALNREIWLRGAIRIELSAKPSIHATRVHVRNVAPNELSTNGLSDIDWLYVGSADVQLDVWQYLLTGDIRFSQVNADDVAVFLEAMPDGSNNWTLSKQSSGDTTAVITARPADERDAPESQPFISRLVLDAVRCNRLYVEYRGPDGNMRLFSLPYFSASAPAGAPVRAQFRGIVDSLFPFQIDFTGGVLTDLADQSKPWPLATIGNALGSTMTINGTVQTDRTTLQFGWGMPDPAEAGRVLQIDLPDVGPTALATQITVSDKKIHLGNLRGWMGTTQLTGDITVQTDGPRPLIVGELAAPVLDLKPFLRGRKIMVPRGSEGPPRTSSTPAQELSTIADWYRAHADTVLDLTSFEQIDADLKLSVGKWLSLPGNIRNASLRVQLADGKLTAPVQAQLAGVRMRGNINIDGGRNEPRVELALGAVDTPLGELAQLLFGMSGVQGHLRSIAFRLEGAGQRIADQVEAMAVHLAMSGGQMTYGNKVGQNPVEFDLNQLVLDVSPGKPMTIMADGSLLDQPLAVNFSSTTFRQLLANSQSRIDLHASSRSMKARIRGIIGRTNSDDNINTNLFVGVSAKRARDVAAWFGIGEKVNAPFTMSGQLQSNGDKWSVQQGRLGVGRNRVRAEVQELSPGKQSLVRATVSADTLNVAQLRALFTSNSDVSRNKSGIADGRSMLNIPVLPTDIFLDDMDLRIRVKHLQRPQFDIRNLSFDTSIRNGRMGASPLSMTILQVPMTGALELDLRSKKPRGQWWLAANNVDMGRLLRRLKVASNMNARADQLSMHLDLRGNKLGEVLESSSLTLEIVGGELAVKDRNTGAAARLRIDSATAQLPAGKKLQAEIKGSWNNEPVRMVVGTARARQFLDTENPVPFNALLEFAGTELELFGKVGRDFGSDASNRPTVGDSPDARRKTKRDAEIKLNMLVSGEKLNSLNQLSGVDLPPWGPYEMNGVVKISADGYEVPNLSVRVGSSQLDGTGVVFTTESPPRVSVLLNSNRLQVNDFKTGNWNPTGAASDKDASEDEGRLDTALVRRYARQASKQTQGLLSEQTLRSINGGLKLTVNDIRSGEDKVGSGSMRLNVYDGVAAIGPVRIRLPDSSAWLKVNYASDADGIDMRTQIGADQFDYGFLARRVQPDTTLAGRLSMDVDISATTPDLSQAMEHSSGVIGFDIWPENVQADVFDLWAANLFWSLASRLDPSTASRVNCGVVRFGMKDGRLTPKKILLDTTRVRVAGEGFVDFKTEVVSLKMLPLPKKSEFFSLATPLVVDGTFDNYSIGTGAGDVAGTVLRLATSLVWVPLNKLFGRSLPDDGSDICGDPDRFLTRENELAASKSRAGVSVGKQSGTRQSQASIDGSENASGQTAQNAARRTPAGPDLVPSPTVEYPKPVLDDPLLRDPEESLYIF